jgi:hypothetical protein
MKTMSLPGLNGHLRVKHGLPRDAAALVTKGKATDDDIEKLRVEFGTDGGNGADAEAAAPPWQPAAGDGEAPEEVDPIEMSRRVIQLCDQLEEVRARRSRVTEGKLLTSREGRAFVGDDKGVAMLDALDSAETAVLDELSTFAPGDDNASGDEVLEDGGETVVLADCEGGDDDDEKSKPDGWWWGGDEDGDLMPESAWQRQCRGG